MNNKNKEPIKAEVLKSVQDSLVQTHAVLIIEGLLDPKAREELKHCVMKEHGYVTKGNKEIADYIVQETVGTGIIEEIIKDETITDIGFNGTDLIIESNDAKYKYEGNININDDYVVRIVQKFANAVGKDFTPKQPILDAVFGNIRINAVYKTISPTGTTMSMRISRSTLVLTEDTFKTFAPDFMYNFFKKAVLIKSNMAISGEVGSGKTEVQKLFMSFIPFKDKIVMIEDVLESHVKELFPEKDTLSWVTNEGISITDLVKASLRNNASWIMVSETRGKEAYEMIQAVLSGHYLITTLHTINARAIPRRLVNMAKIGYSVSEEALEEDILRYFDFGIHVKKVKFNGYTIRYLSEVIEFNIDGNVTVFKQRFINGTFHCNIGELSNEYKERLIENNIEFEFPEEKEFKWKWKTN